MENPFINLDNIIKAMFGSRIKKKINSDEFQVENLDVKVKEFTELKSKDAVFTIEVKVSEEYFKRLKLKAIHVEEAAQKEINKSI